MHSNALLSETGTRRPQSIGREYLAGGKVKGGVLRAHIAWTREWAEPTQLKTLEDALDGDVRPALSSVVFATRWYPFRWLVELQKAIVDVLGEGDRSILRQAGRYSAAANLHSVFRAFDRDDPNKFFRFSALLHIQFQDFGSATYQQTGPNQGRMVHRHCRCFSPHHCESWAGWYEQCARMHGVAEVIVEETGCQCAGDTNCTFEIAWS
jgi:predicted hydrocarbon binding protein